MKKRTRTIVIVALVLGVLAMAGPSIIWYTQKGEQHDAGAQGEAEKAERQNQRDGN